MPEKIGVMRLPVFLALLSGLALAGCGDTVRTAPINAQTLRSLASVRLDPASATAKLNAYRASQGLGPVKLDPTLAAMAQRQVAAMAAADALSHDAAGSFTARIAAAGLDATRAGENIGAGYYSFEEAFAGWRDSSEHNGNLLMPQATRFGIAMAKDARTRLRVFWAMEIAADPEKRPAVLALQLPPQVNSSAAPH
jgi:uncharacterized protein YkwD